MIQKLDISTFVDVDTVSSIEEKMVDRFKKRLRELNISQRTLAEESDVSFASIRRFVSTGEISLSSLIKLAIAMDCTSEFASLFSVSKAKRLKDME